MDNGGQTSSLTPDSNNGGLDLPTGFGVITVSTETGAARHITFDVVAMDKQQDAAMVLKSQFLHFRGTAQAYPGSLSAFFS